MVGHDSHASSPPRLPVPVTELPTGLAAEIGEGDAQETHDSPELVAVDQDSSTEKAQEALTGDPAQQQVFVVRGQSDKCLVMDHDTHECFFLKWKTLKKDERKGREFDPRYYNVEEEKAFAIAEEKE